MKPSIIISADDFGLSDSCNSAIFKVASNNLINSIHIMVTRESIEEQDANRLKILHRNFGVRLSLHLEMPNKDNISIANQLSIFQDALDINPSYISLHKMTNTNEELKFMNKLSIDHNIPIRNTHKSVTLPYTQKNYISASGYSQYNLGKLINEHIYNDIEIVLHPGDQDDNLDSSFTRIREIDLNNLLTLNIRLN